MSVGGVGGNYNVGDLTSYQAPKQSGFSKFANILGGVASSLPGVGPAFSALGAGGGQNNQMELLQTQMKMQMFSQQINMISNINKTKHEASMAAIRNVK